jgi:arginyl-tRNA synthetase
VPTLRQQLADLVSTAAEAARAAGKLPDIALPEVVVDRPQRQEHGDYATNLPLRMARAARMNPMDLAAVVAEQMDAPDLLDSVEAAPPGFINMRLADSWLQAQVNAVREAGPRLGNLDIGAGKRVQVEFVSANPTGPLHVGNGRGAALGDTLASVLAAAGYAVEREYYVNDAGTQTDTFTETLYARYQQQMGRDVSIPEDGYPGEYMVDVARAIAESEGSVWLRPEGEQAPPEIREKGIEQMVLLIRQDLERLGVGYDVWFSERALYGAGGDYGPAMQRLRENGYVSDREGATWFTSTALGEDKDNVLVRSSGKPTYFASDIAYHYNKLVTRNFDLAIDIWGADHHGHVSRMKAAVEALGLDRSRLEILIYQLVIVKRGGEAVRLSKRAGELITLRELIDEVGADACRFFFLQRSADSQMEFDLELAKRQSAENPVYYVQYGHARIAGILRNAEERGLTPVDADVSLLSHPAELALVRKMLQLSELIESAAATLEPHSLPHYAIELATAFHAFYTECRVISEDEALTRARLALVEAARVALARTLGLMGVSAPDRM